MFSKLALQMAVLYVLYWGTARVLPPPPAPDKVLDTCVSDHAGCVQKAELVFAKHCIEGAEYAEDFQIHVALDPSTGEPLLGTVRSTGKTLYHLTTRSCGVIRIYWEPVK